MYERAAQIEQKEQKERKEKDMGHWALGTGQ